MVAFPNDPRGSDRYTSDSLDCIDVEFDGPGDNTRRPLTGEALKRAKAWRELIDRWGTTADAELSSDESEPEA